MVHNILSVQVLREDTKKVLFERQIEVNNALQFPFENTINVLTTLFAPIQVVVNFSCSSYKSIH